MFKSKSRPTAFQSTLHDQTSFYQAFKNDLSHCSQELIIESPFITLRRVRLLSPALSRLRDKGIHITINTRNPAEHDSDHELQALEAIALLQAMNVSVLYTVKHHRKLAVLDRSIVWEGSLNILSHYDSCEIMRRISSPIEAQLLLQFIKLDKHLQEQAND